MSRVCDICKKKRQVGNNVSHANNRNKRVWHPNIQKVRLNQNGTSKRIRVCTRCIRSGAIQKPIR